LKKITNSTFIDNKISHMNENKTPKKALISFEIQEKENGHFEVVNPQNDDYIPAKLMFDILGAVILSTEKYNKTI